MMHKQARGKLCASNVAQAASREPNKSHLLSRQSCFVSRCLRCFAGARSEQRGKASSHRPPQPVQLHSALCRIRFDALPSVQ